LKLYPTAAEFQKLADEFNVIPIMQEYIADELTPVGALRRLGLDRQPYTFLLESVEGGQKLGRYSFVGVSMKEIVEIWPGRICLRDGTGKLLIQFPSQDPLAYLEARTQEFKLAPSPIERMPCGFVGYAGYELVHTFEKLPPRKKGPAVPDCVFALPEVLLVFDHVQGTVSAVANVFLKKGQKLSSYQEAIEKMEEVVARLSSHSAGSILPSPRGKVREGKYRSNFTKGEFLEAVQKAKEYIAKGEVQQVVPSQRFEVELKRPPLDLYCALRAINPSPYLFYLKFGEFGLVGSSPEMLVRLEDQRAMVRPIAGTRPRGRDASEDAALEEQLLADEKEKAEHEMLIHLALSDLAKVCRRETVRATERFAIERYSHVMHLVSQVEGELHRDKNLFHLFKAAFPAGTLTGSPKVRAMELIAELEPTARGPYGGAVGYFGFGGNMDFCITIRTIIYQGNRAWLQAGAGIVAGSQPEKEYQETINKAQALLQAVLA